MRKLINAWRLVDSLAQLVVAYARLTPHTALRALANWCVAWHNLFGWPK